MLTTAPTMPSTVVHIGHVCAGACQHAATNNKIDEAYKVTYTVHTHC